MIGYALIMVAAIVVAAVLARRYQRGLGLGAAEKLGIGLGAFIGAMIGAKLPFALGHWPEIWSAEAWIDNGKTIVFGIVGGYFGVEIAKALLGVQVKTGDGFAVPVAAGVAIGRLSCFHAGCCYGLPTTLPWGVDFGDGIKRHPTQIYELIFHAMMALILARLFAKGALKGQLIKLYLIAYLIYRFITEWLRPEKRIAWGLTGYQWSALALIPLFIALWIRDAVLLRNEDVPRDSLPASPADSLG